MTEHRLPLLAVVGGFLGSGKTTLLLAAARVLQSRGLRAAVITNDQGGALVDTRMAAAAGISTGEVAGACFCCRFSDLIAAAERLLAARPDVIFAESVGSCMDVSATVLQPLKQFHGGQFRLAPFSVLVDPRRAGEILRPDANPHLAYLFRNQIAEADLLLFTKADLDADVPEIPGVAARRVSALTGQGMAEWVDEITSGRLSAGGRLLDIDYSRYAAAEASLGWLNWEGELRFARAVTPAAVAGPLLERLDEELTRAAVSIAHLKIFDRTGTGYITAAICRNGEAHSVGGDLLAAPGRHHELVLNLRAGGSPSALESAVGTAMRSIPGRVRIHHQQAFQPAPPVPEHRFRTVVGSDGS